MVKLKIYQIKEMRRTKIKIKLRLLNKGNIYYEKTQMDLKHKNILMEEWNN